MSLPVLIFCAAAQSAPAQTAEVFAPGIVSLDTGNVYRGSFTPDGTEFYFFRKVDGDREDYRIYVSRLEGGAWTPPRRVDLGGEYSDLYPSISPSGTRMVFTSYRPVPGDTNSHPNANLYYTDRTPSGWAPPVLMTEASTLENYDSWVHFVAEDEIAWISTTPDWRTRLMRRARWNGTAYSAPEPDTLLAPWADWRDDVYVWDGLLSPAGDVIVLSVSPVSANGRRGPVDLWAARRTRDGWSDPVRLGAGVNTRSATENFQLFSRDGRTLYFVRDFSMYYRVSLDAALRTR